MKMIKIMFLGFALLSICHHGLSQYMNGDRKINWQAKKRYFSPVKEEPGTKEKYLLSFENAVYMHEINDLPHYNELIPINDEKYKVTIQDLQFNTLNTDEIREVSGLPWVKNDIIVSTQLVYQQKKPFTRLSFIPLRKNPQTGLIEKLTGFTVQIERTGNLTKGKKTKTYVENSVLSSGTWFKIKIDKSGVYKISYDELRALGISDPGNARIFGNGGKMLSIYNDSVARDDLVENKVLKQNNAIYFYGEGPVEWKRDPSTGFFRQQKHLYSDYSWYFISSDYNPGTDNNIKTLSQTGDPVTHMVNTFTEHVYHEIDSSNLIGSGRLWVGEAFDFNPELSLNFSIPGLVDNSAIITETSLLARSPLSSSFTITINNQSNYSSFAAVNYSYTSTFATHKIEKFTGNTGTSDNINIKLTYNKSTASSEAWLDYVCINAPRMLNMGTEQLNFRNTESVGPGNVSEFTITNANNQSIVWNITNPQEPLKVMSSINGNNQTFRLHTDSVLEFVVFNESNVYKPILSGTEVGIVQNQNLHGLPQPDLIIVYHPEFYDQALELKNLHESNDQLRVALVNNQQIYNEFSSGAPDVSAIRNFVKMFYDRALNSDQMPKYLCLFGDGSYDNKRNTPDNTNFILTYQSDNSLNPTQSFVTDDFFGLLDQGEGGHDGLLDIGIGRLPVKTKTEASAAINKIKSYLQIESYGDWRNHICFIADDEDYNLHVEQADELSRIVKNSYPVFNIEKIYLDAYPQQSSSSGQHYPDVNRTLDNMIAKGILLLNYTGHGNESWLAEENILDIEQILKYENFNKLNVFMTATCEFSRFDNYSKTTAGEHVFLNPKGASIALFTTTRLVYASPNFELNKNFYQYIFEKDPATGMEYRLGDVMRHTKNESGSGINKRNFTLLGDPALKIASARLMVKTNTIRLSNSNEITDTIKALQKISVEGEILDEMGQKLNTYNGLIYPIVFDKKQDIKTLDNDGQGSFSYSILNSQVFKGKASVNNGNFQFSFIVPKDIRYNIDTGKISYYSTNYRLLEDGKGSFTNFFIGGVSDTSIADKQGPEIKIFMNNENFVSGGITNKNPRLLVRLGDESGINTTGNGIGHDIVAKIDDSPDLKFVLNEYYESEVDDYSQGKITYSLPELENGEHVLHLKAWDVFNNSNEDSIVFRVESNTNFTIDHVLNYPNPFSTHTTFYFEHNRPNELLDVIIHIFTVSGKVIKTIQTQEISDGYRNSGISWDGQDDFGNKPGRGAYFYRLTVRTSTGEKTSKTEKMLILN